MGVGVSNWKLARAVSQSGQLGVVSGTLLAVVLARRLQQGDLSGDVRRALARLPFPAIAARVLERWFINGGKRDGQPFKSVEMPSLAPSPALTELTVAANFVEVFLAKEGHEGCVGINLLEKIQFPTLASLFGAMLAGVDYVLMGAGIPRAIPGVLDRFARGEAAELKVDVTGAPSEGETTLRLDPASFGEAPLLNRPRFLAIVSSATLAATLARKSSGRVDGFIVEGELAGGHNAPPRGPLQLNERGEPVYGPRDVPDLEKIRALGLPFWLAGAHATAERLAEAQGHGAAGVQVGTAFAFCAESGITSELKAQALAISRLGTENVHTDPLASPTGFPFKVLRQPGTLASPGGYAARPRICDLGYLREANARADGTVAYRCGSEPVANFVRKGGDASDCAGRMCLCNGLLATVGLGQVQAGGYREPALVTAGNDIANLHRYVRPGADSYDAADVLRVLLAPPRPACAAVDQNAFESVTEPK